MITLTVAPRYEEDLYAMLVKREVELRRNRQGTLHRHGARQRGRDKWMHKAYKGRITFQRGLGGVLVAVVESPVERDEWQLLTSFIGFLHRHLRESISNISLTYAEE